MVAAAKMASGDWSQRLCGAIFVSTLFAVTSLHLMALVMIGCMSKDNDNGHPSDASSSLSLPSLSDADQLVRRRAPRSAAERVERSATGAAAAGERVCGSWLRHRFRPIMAKSAKELAVRTLLEADLLLRGVGVQYFLYAGMLIGSHRHHGMIPWDDDVDIIVNVTQRELIRTVLSDRPGYGLYTDYPFTYKWYSLAGVGSAGKSFKWPYIDIFFFGENETHIYDAERAYCEERVYRKADVFPLVLRPFEGELLPTPRNPAAVLGPSFNVTTCQTSGYVHTTETYIPPQMRLTVECSKLNSMFPFVFCRKMVGDMCVKEILRFGSTVISKFIPQLPFIEQQQLL